MVHGLLEVIALDASDARSAVDGGADRLELVSAMEFSGFDPSIRTFQAIRAAVNVPLRVMIRGSVGFASGGAQGIARLVTTARRLRAEGADEFVLGWLDDTGVVDLAAVHSVVAALDGAPWTFHKAIDYSTDRDAVYAAIRPLPGLDTVLTSGGPQPAGQGVDVLAAEAAREAAHGDDGLALLVGGGLRIEDVPRLRTVGLNDFHIGTAARDTGDWSGPVESRLVAAWRAALDRT
jgi:copper homeostasis protein